MSTLLSFLERLRQRGAAFRMPLLLLAAAVFAAGSLYALRRLSLSPSDVRLPPLLLLVLVISPLNTAYSAANLILMSRAARVRMGFIEAVRVNVYAQLAELLPIPGGAIVRTAALVRAGASPFRGTDLVLSFSLLWIACATFGAGIALLWRHWVGLPLAIGGAAAVTVLHVWLAYRYGHLAAAAATGLRILGLALVAVRLTVCFLALGWTVSVILSLCFAFATIMGTAASLVPAGLGLGEGLAALIAGPAKVPPAAAFLAVAISRIAGLFTNIFLALTFALADTRRDCRARPAIARAGSVRS